MPRIVLCVLILVCTDPIRNSTHVLFSIVFMDELLSLLPRFGFKASVFFHGEFCGQTQFLANESVGQLHLVSKGQVIMEHNDRPPLHVTEPSLVFYPRPYDHRLVVPQENLASLLCANVRFHDAARNPIALALPDVMCIRLNEEAGLAPTLSLLFAEALVEDIGKRMMMDRLCDMLVIHLVRYARKMKLIRKGAIAGLSDIQIAPVMVMLHAEPGRAWSVVDMAALARMSRTTFINHFQSVVGMPPAEYLTGWRMELAKTYLKEGRSVKEVAQTVGYSYQPGFTNAFKSRCGVSPTDWLKHACEDDAW